jgi:hypothetical protein
MELNKRDADEVGRLWSSMTLVDNDATLGEDEDGTRYTLVKPLLYGFLAYATWRGFKRTGGDKLATAAWAAGAWFFPVPAVLLTVYKDGGIKL